MVQTSAEPDLYETLRHASRSGAGLPLEVLAALEHSLPLKRATARLRSLAVWGRITTRSGRVRACVFGVCVLAATWQACQREEKGGDEDGTEHSATTTTTTPLASPRPSPPCGVQQTTNNE